MCSAPNVIRICEVHCLDGFFSHTYSLLDLTPLPTSSGNTIPGRAKEDRDRQRWAKHRT